MVLEGDDSTEAGFHDLRILVWIDNANVTGTTNTTRKMNFTSLISDSVP